MTNRQLAIIALIFVAILIWLLACDDSPTPPVPKAQAKPTPKQTADAIFTEPDLRVVS